MWEDPRNAFDPTLTHRHLDGRRCYWDSYFYQWVHHSHRAYTYCDRTHPMKTRDKRLSDTDMLTVGLWAVGLLLGVLGMVLTLRWVV